MAGLIGKVAEWGALFPVIVGPPIGELIGEVPWDTLVRRKKN